MKPVYFVLLLSLVTYTSCIKNTAEYQVLKEQNDSLLRVKHQMQEELDGFISAMNQIEQNIEKIKSTESIVSLDAVGNELDDDARTKINQNLLYLNELLKTNKSEIERLKIKIKTSSFKSAELERAILRLSKALQAESLKVELLYAQLAQKDSLIIQLGSTVDDMSKNIEELKSENESKQSKIAEQDETIHTAWYVFGTRKELKEQNIITSEGIFKPQRVLQSDFNKSYFVRIDARNTKSIPLYSTRAKILTIHPKTSYTLDKENDNFVLVIVDTKEFWSVSKYLVIEVD
ncbi:MAG: hypothetical protein Q7U47_06150 [Paludibacter sp.]|nr:hypothetical protein [Paludibacter sp.]